MIHLLPSLRYGLLGLLLAVSSQLTKAAEELVEVQFVCFQFSAKNATAQLVTGKGEVIEVELPARTLSPVYKITKPGKWSLGKQVADKEGNMNFQSYGSANMLPAKRQLVLVTRQGANNEEGLNLHPFAFGGNGFNGGQYLFYNASTVDIFCAAGDLKFLVPPKEFRLVEPKPSLEENNRGYLYVQFYFRKMDKIKPFRESTWRYSKKAKSIVFFYHDEHTKQLRTRTIRE